MTEEKKECPSCGPGRTQEDRPCPACGRQVTDADLPGGPDRAEGEAPPPAPELITRPEPPEPPVRTGLSGIGALFANSSDIYKRRFPVFVRIIFFYMLPFIVLTGFSELASDRGVNPALSLGLNVLLALTMLLSLFGQFVLITSITDRASGFEEASRKALAGFHSYLWILFLFTAVSVSGFVLLFVPGLVFIIWFGFAFFVYAAEGEKGIRALLKSKEYVRGRWGGVFMRLALIWLTSFFLGLLPFAGPFLALFFMPFVFSFEYLIYADLKTEKSAFVFSPSEAEKRSWVIIAVLGFLIGVLLYALVQKFDPEERLKGLTPISAPAGEQIRTAPAGPGL